MANIATIHDRIALLVKEKAGNKNTALAQTLGVSEANIRGYIRGVVPKADVLAKIVTSYDDISPEWLLTGEGPMLKSSTPKPSEAASKPQAATTPPPSSPRREKDGKPSAADDAATFLSYIKDREDTHRAELDKKDTIIEQKNLEIRALDRKLALAEGENRHLSLDNDRLTHDLDTLRQEVAHLRSTHP